MLITDQESVRDLGAEDREKGSKHWRGINHSYSLTFSLHNSCPKQDLL